MKVPFSSDFGEDVAKENVCIDHWSSYLHVSNQYNKMVNGETPLIAATCAAQSQWNV
jgi:hypothetical protein